jgi:hypothetical protein
VEVYLHSTSDSSGKGKVTLINCHVMGSGIDCVRLRKALCLPLACSYLLRHDWRQRFIIREGTLSLTISRFSLWGRGRGACKIQEKKKHPKEVLW